MNIKEFLVFHMSIYRSYKVQTTKNNYVNSLNELVFTRDKQSVYCKVGTLTFQSLAVTLRTTRFNIKKFYVVPTLRLFVLYGSQNKQQLLPYKTLRDRFV
jgi:hypothetical protein